MICIHCGKPVVLSPSAEERAKKDVTGKSAAYYRSLFRSHAECQVRYRDSGQTYLIPKDKPCPTAP